MVRSLMALLFVGIAPANACRLSFPAALVRGRIAHIDVAMKHVAAQAPKLPAGWVLTIDNDPSWTTHASGHAIVGSAFLSVEDLRSMLTFVPEPSFSCRALGIEGSPAVTIGVYADDRVRPVRIGREWIRVSP